MQNNSTARQLEYVAAMLSIARLYISPGHNFYLPRHAGIRALRVDGHGLCPGAKDAMKGRGGLRARILTDRILQVDAPA